MGAEITNLRYLGAVENIFTFDGQPGHEIVMVYEADFVDQSIYEKAAIPGLDDGDLHFTAAWKPLSDFQSGQAILYLAGLLDLLLHQSDRASSDAAT